MVRKRTVIDRSRRSNHNSDARGPARAHPHQRGFVQHHDGQHVDQPSGVKCADSPGKHRDAGFAACGILTSGRGGALDVGKDGGF